MTHVATHSNAHKSPKIATPTLMKNALIAYHISIDLPKKSVVPLRQQTSHLKNFFCPFIVLLFI